MTNTDTSEANGYYVRSIWTSDSPNTPWRTLVRDVLEHVCIIELSCIYGYIENHPKTFGKKHWRSRVRATLHGDDDFVRVFPRLWSLSSRYSEDLLGDIRKERRDGRRFWQRARRRN